MVIGGFLLAIGGAIGCTAYFTSKKNEEEIDELPFVEEITEEIETDF